MDLMVVKQDRLGLAVELVVCIVAGLAVRIAVELVVHIVAGLAERIAVKLGFEAGFCQSLGS